MIENDIIYSSLVAIFFEGFASLILMFVPIIAIAALGIIALTLCVILKPLCVRWYRWIKNGIGLGKEDVYEYEFDDDIWEDLPFDDTISMEKG